MPLTILTPTYNRANRLNKLYESLLSQTVGEFKWLIVDDGSTDNTADLIKTFLDDERLEIKYLYKINGGKHTAINEGIRYVQTPLTFIVDSDDYLTENAVEIILNIWEKYQYRDEIGSFWFLQSDSTGRIIGDMFPEEEFVSTYLDVMINSTVKGDKKAVYRTELLRKYPFPVFDGETFLGEGIIHKRIGDCYKSVFINKVIYKGDYLEGGLSDSGRELRIKNPLGGMANSKEFVGRDVNLRIRIKKMTLYLTYGMFSGLKYWDIVCDSEFPVLAVVCTPMSLVLFMYWLKAYGSDQGRS